MDNERVLWDGKDNDIVVAFAHGAGAGPDSEFMQHIATNLAREGLAVMRFEFPYWAQVRTSGRKRPPDRQPQLQARMQQVTANLGSRPLWLMGKSMGARVAFKSAQAAAAIGCIGLGFPFHPAGKPHKTRTHEIFNDCARNLIVQGTHDPMGKQTWVSEQDLPANLVINWVAQGNHDLVPKKSRGLSATESWHLLSLEVAEFIKEHTWRS